MLGVIDDNGQLVGVLAIRAQQDKVADIRFQMLCLRALDTVVKADRPVIHAQAPGAGRFALAHAGPAGAGVGVAAINGFVRGGIGNLAPGAGAAIGQPQRLELFKCRSVGIEPLALPHHRAIPHESEGFQRAQDAVCCAGLGARGVDVFHAYPPDAAVLSGIEVAARGGDERAKVERAAG